MQKSNRIYLLSLGAPRRLAGFFALPSAATSSGVERREGQTRGAPARQTGSGSTPEPEKILHRPATCSSPPSNFPLRPRSPTTGCTPGGKSSSSPLTWKPSCSGPTSSGSMLREIPKTSSSSMTARPSPSMTSRRTLMPSWPAGDHRRGPDRAHKDYGLTVALADLSHGQRLRCDDQGPRKHALYVGKGLVRGVKCHHLAFDKDDIQWQIWIDAGQQACDPRTYHKPEEAAGRAPVDVRILLIGTWPLSSATACLSSPRRIKR